MRRPLSVSAYSFRRPFSTKVRLQSMWITDKLLTTENGAMYRGAAEQGKRVQFCESCEFLANRLEAIWWLSYTAKRKRFSRIQALRHTHSPSLSYPCVKEKKRKSCCNMPASALRKQRYILKTNIELPPFAFVHVVLTLKLYKISSSLRQRTGRHRRLCKPNCSRLGCGSC